MISASIREQDHSVTLTTPAAGMGKRSRNELDSLEINGPGQVLILPNIQTITSHLDHLEARFTELEQELDTLVALHDRLVALQERIICDNCLDHQEN